MNAPTDAAAELKPCPFCGNDGSGAIEDALHVVHTQNEGHMFYDCYSVQCDRCTGTMGYSESREDAIAAWNTRPPTDAAAVREAAARVDVVEAGQAALRDIRNAVARSERSGHKQAHLNFGPLSVALMAIESALSAAAIRQLDLPGGEEVERLRAALDDAARNFDALYHDSFDNGVAPTDVIARVRRDAARYAADARQALTPARVERSRE